MKKKLTLLILMTILTNSIVQPIHAAWEEELCAGLSAGLILGAVSGWAATYHFLNKKHKQALREKDSNHQQAIELSKSKIKSLQEIIDQHKTNEKTPQEIFGPLAI